MGREFSSLGWSSEVRSGCRFLGDALGENQDGERHTHPHGDQEGRHAIDHSYFLKLQQEDCLAFQYTCPLGVLDVS